MGERKNRLTFNDKVAETAKREDGAEWDGRFFVVGTVNCSVIVWRTSIECQRFNLFRDVTNTFDRSPGERTSGRLRAEALSAPAATSEHVKRQRRNKAAKERAERRKEIKLSVTSAQLNA